MPLTISPTYLSAMDAGYDNNGTLTMNVPPNDILRLTAPDSTLMGGNMNAFDHDINYDGGDLLCVFPSISPDV